VAVADFWFVTLSLAAATFSLRFGGYLLGRRLPAHGGWAAAFRALPGTIIVALVTVILMRGGPAEWAAALVSAVVATLSRSLPLTMIAGIGAVVLFRHFA
jgi:uncharacterized membrane protein